MESETKGSWIHSLLHDETFGTWHEQVGFAFSRVVPIRA